jgi:hypothetical protein
LEIAGEPGATVFLSGGYLTYAESPGVPDLRSRLVGGGRLPGQRWSQVSADARTRGSIGGLLVRSGIIEDGELRDLLWSITLDALIAMALPLPAAGPSLAEVRFWPRRSHLIGSHLRLDLAAAWAAAGQKAERLARGQAAADARPLLADLWRPWAVMSSQQWALAWQIDGQATIKDLAWRSGFALCDTRQWVDDLIRAGLCVTAEDADLPGASTAGSSSAPEQEPAFALPHRHPGASLAARSAKARPPVVPQWRAADIPRPPETSNADLLHRILRGLRRTDKD